MVPWFRELATFPEGLGSGHQHGSSQLPVTSLLTPKHTCDAHTDMQANAHTYIIQSFLKEESESYLRHTSYYSLCPFILWQSFQSSPNVMSFEEVQLLVTLIVAYWLCFSTLAPNCTWRSQWSWEAGRAHQSITVLCWPLLQPLKTHRTFYIILQVIFLFP